MYACRTSSSGNRQLPAATPTSRSAHHVEVALETADRHLPLARSFGASSTAEVSLLGRRGDAGFRREGTKQIHRRSGLVCDDLVQVPVSRDDVATLSLAEIKTFGQGDRDVACSYVAQDGQFVLTYYASLWLDLTAAEHVEEASAVMASEFPNPQPVPTPAFRVVRGEGSVVEEESVGGAFYFSNGAVRGAVALWVARVDGWHIKTTVTTLPPNANVIAYSVLAHEAQVATVDRRRKRSS